MAFKPGDLVFSSYGRRRFPLTFIGYQERPREQSYLPRKVMVSGPHNLVFHLDERDIVDAETYRQNEAETEAKVRRDLKRFLCAFPIVLCFMALVIVGMKGG